MRVGEFMQLQADPLGEAIHEVSESIRQDSPGGDHMRAAMPGTPTYDLLLFLEDRVRDRGAEYGERPGLFNGLMLAFRLGAAYGRRVLAPKE